MPVPEGTCDGVGSAGSALCGGILASRVREPRRRCQCRPWDRDLNTPSQILVRRIVQRAVELDRAAQPHHVPRDVCPAPAVVGPVEEEVELGAQRVDLELVVGERVAVGIDEHLEVMLAVEDRVAVGEGGPEVGLLQFGPDVEVRVVPQDLRAGRPLRRRPGFAPDVDEGIRPGGETPRGVGQVAVDGGRRRGARGVVGANVCGILPVQGRRREMGRVPSGDCRRDREAGKDGAGAVGHLVRTLRFTRA